MVDVNPIPELRFPEFENDWLIKKLEDIAVRGTGHTPDKKSKDYKKYSEQTRMKLINDIYKTYDKYLSNEYKVNVNNNAVERVKKYFE